MFVSLLTPARNETIIAKFRRIQFFNKSVFWGAVNISSHVFSELMNVLGKKLGRSTTASPSIGTRTCPLTRTNKRGKCRLYPMRNDSEPPC